MLFNNNNTALISLLKGCAKNPDFNKLAWIFWKFAREANCAIWIERVNSAANSADVLSRKVTVLGHSDEFREIREARRALILRERCVSLFVFNSAAEKLRNRNPKDQGKTISKFEKKGEENYGVSTPRVDSE